MGTLRDLQFALQLKIEELRQRDTLIDELELELDTKDDLIRRLQGELDRHRATLSSPGQPGASAGGSVQSYESRRARRKTIFSEPLILDPETLPVVTSTAYSKSQRLQDLIQTAFSESDLLKHLSSGQSQAVIDSMYPTTVNKHFLVTQEGARGTCAYVLEDGKMEVMKDAQKLFTIEAGQVFGELALLYNCTYNFSISAITNSKCWVIERRSFQAVVKRCVLNKLSCSMELLRCVPFLHSLPDDVLRKMCDTLEETHYRKSDYIFRQGATGDTFYIISNGQVKVTEKKSSTEETELSSLSRGHWFGEKALRGDDVRAVSVIAASDVTCLLIDRESFRQIIGGVMDDSHYAQDSSDSTAKSDEHAAVLCDVTLSDFQVICHLGEGEMGHVELVKLNKSNIRCPFAMRVLRKRLLLNAGRQEHVLRERHNLMEARCPFIVRLYCTFRDAKCLYMLTEACLGGELWTLLQDRALFDDITARFYTACVVLALGYLHCRGVVYRDLKPENVILDQRGYAKLVGLGCAKKVGLGKKTWTFCGTPGYMAPEIILNQGHSASADLWSLGVFVFELLSGSLPFGDPDPLSTFTAALRGVDLVEFPKTIGENASSLIKKLCRNSPSERLGNRRNGAKDIQRHKWFEGFDWEGLSEGTFTPPVIPKFNSHLENGKVEPVSESREETPEEESDWDKDF